MKDCKFCRESVSTDVVDPIFRLEVTSHPHNPDWPLDKLDAGIFCSAHCLVAYLSDAWEVTR